METISLQGAEALGVLQALTAMESYEEPVEVTEDGVTQTKMVKRRYKYSGSTRMKVAKNIAALKAVGQAVYDARNDLIRSFGGDTVPPERVSEFVLEEQKLLGVKHDVSMHKLTMDDLQLEENDLPATVLTNLLPLIGEE